MGGMSSGVGLGDTEIIAAVTIARQNLDHSAFFYVKARVSLSPIKPLLFKGGVGVDSCRLSLRERCKSIATTPTHPLKMRGFYQRLITG